MGGFIPQISGQTFPRLSFSMRREKCHSERSEESLLKGLKRDSSLHFVPFRMTKTHGAQENDTFFKSAYKWS